MFTMAVFLADAVCNGNCLYCYAGYNKGKQKKKFTPDFERFKKEVSEFYEVDKKNVGEEVHLEIWGGETTINKWLAPTCEAVNEIFSAYDKVPSITVVTNGFNIYDAYLKTPSNVKFQISNDLCYQKETRGRQYMEEEEWNKQIKEIYDNNRLSGFQSVITSETSDVLAMYHYFIKWEEQVGIDVSWGLMVCKSYGEEGTEHLFNKDNCEVLQSSVVNLFREILLHKEQGIELKADNRILQRSFFASLPQLMDISGFGGRVMYPCMTFSRKSCFLINGERYSCPHDVELGLTSTESLKRYEEVYEKCAGCTYRWQCRGICSGATRAEKEKNCENLWIYYSSFRRAMLAYMPINKLEEIEDAQIIQSYRNP